MGRLAERVTRIEEKIKAQDKALKLAYGNLRVFNKASSTFWTGIILIITLIIALGTLIVALLK